MTDEDLASQLAGRARAPKRKKVSEVFNRPSDDIGRFTTYLPKSTIAALKQRALDEQTPATKLVQEAVEELLSRPARDPNEAENERLRRRSIM